MNTDQGSQFTSIDFIKALKDAGIQISTDGKGAWRDTIFVERLWRSIKYEAVYLRAYDSVTAARAGRALPGVLQHKKTALIAGRADARPGISQPATADPACGITERENRLGNGSKLFRRTEPPLTIGAPSSPCFRMNVSALP